MTSKFEFLSPHYPQLYKISQISEKLYEIDPNSTISKSRLFTEKMMEIIFKVEELEILGGSQVDQIKELFSRNVLPKGVKNLFHKIRKLGNRAVHKGDLSSHQALIVLRACYKLAVWFVATYEKIFIDDGDYDMPINTTTKTVNELETEVDKAPIVSEAVEEKIKNENYLPALVAERRQRSKEYAERLGLGAEMLAGALGLIPAVIGAATLGVSPVGLAAGVISGVGYLAFKYKKRSKRK